MLKSKNKISRLFFNSKFFTVLGLAVIILISLPTAKNFSQRRKINNEIKELQNEIHSIENKNTELKQFINYLGSDQYAEEQARLNLGFKKEGEEVAVIDINKGEDNKINVNDNVFNIPGLDKQETKKHVNNPKRWWNYFFNRL